MPRPAVVFEVHVAGVPGPDHIQRCLPCGAVLYNGRPWYEGRIAVPVGQERDGPGWWPAGALVATDKPRDGSAHPGGSMTFVIEGRALDPDERPCTPG
jgi:hypothetical protein